ncbi:MAG TPA: deoxyribonuclease IV [Ktedonobacterales bacterium]|nr:deoxyribonuclease IV [Ktedonobacterales bacterium]
MRFGRHLANTPKGLQEAQSIGCDAIQVFLTNPRGWAAPAHNPALVKAFRAAAERYGQSPVVVHAAYLINLASPRPEIFDKSVTLLRATLERASLYGASSVVFHVGSATGTGEEAGLERLIAGVRQVMTGAPEDVPLLLENDTGGGGKVGYRFENLALVLAALPEFSARLGVCLDTAHLWAAGYDIGTPEGARAVLDQAESIIGLDRAPVLHVNDAREACGSHRDIHARIGEGMIPIEGLTTFLRDPRVAHTTGILETPIPTLAEDDNAPDWVAERAHMALARSVAGLAMPDLPDEETEPTTRAG